MRQQEVFNKIGSILNELNEQYDYLKSLSLPFDDLELELLSANANFLCDHLEILRKLNTALSKGNEAMKSLPDVESLELADENTENPIVISSALAGTMLPVGHFHVEQAEDDNDSTPGFEFDLAHTDTSLHNKEEQYDLPEANDIVYLEEAHKETSGMVEPITIAEDKPVPHIDLKADTGRDHFSFIRSTEPDSIRHDLELSEAGTFSDDENAPHEETVAEALAQIEITLEQNGKPAPKEEEKQLTLNERMAAQSGNTQQLKTAQPITDLKAAINLNDKMLFVRDLFNGYSLAYSEAIEILNRFSKLEDAERFLSVNYEAKNNWASKPITREKFYELLKRRFA